MIWMVYVCMYVYIPIYIVCLYQWFTSMFPCNGLSFYEASIYNERIREIETILTCFLVLYLAVHRSSSFVTTRSWGDWKLGLEMEVHRTSSGS